MLPYFYSLHMLIQQVVADRLNSPVTLGHISQGIILQDLLLGLQDEDNR